MIVPIAERLYQQHRTGTFEEIHANGDRVTKVIGDNYEIVILKSTTVLSKVPEYYGGGFCSSSNKRLHTGSRR